MEYSNLTFQEIANCRIVASKESFMFKRTVTWQEVASREIAKALQGTESLVELKDYDDSTDNIGKYIYLEFSSGDCKRVYLVDSLDSVNSDYNTISINSPVGKHLKYAKIDELIQINDTIIRVVDITKRQLDASN